MLFQSGIAWRTVTSDRESAGVVISISIGRTSFEKIAFFPNLWTSLGVTGVDLDWFGLMCSTGGHIWNDLWIQFFEIICRTSLVRGQSLDKFRLFVDAVRIVWQSDFASPYLGDRSSYRVQISQDCSRDIDPPAVTRPTLFALTVGYASWATRYFICMSGYVTGRHLWFFTHPDTRQCLD